MEKLERTIFRWLLLAVMGVAMAGYPCRLLASSPAEQALLTKAQSLASHGHLDMAIQTWQQVLLSNPESKEALTGIARAEMQLGKPNEAQRYLDRLRALGADAASIEQIESMPRVEPQGVRLAEARRLAQDGKYDDAMRIYRGVYGDEPPAGDAALAYYDTEAAIPADRQHAVDGLRKLAQRFPADSRYAITLGRVLTYDPKSRAEGISLLKQFPSSTEAQDALQQASVWNETAAVAGPAVAPTHTESPANSPESVAYRALNSGHLDEAKRRFQLLLAKEPKNPGALSGMGYVLMKEQDFSNAESYLERARSAGAKGVDSAIALSRFWQRMAKGDTELANGQSDAAITDYREATNLEPTRPEALEALGGALLQKGNATDAADLFERALAIDQNRPLSWRGLFQAQSTLGDAEGALATNKRMPPEVRTGLESDPDYLRALAQDDLALGRNAEFDQVAKKALALPFPDQGRTMTADRLMQYAALLASVHRDEPAVRLYRRVLASNPQNLNAWKSLIALEHQLHRDDEALATIGRIPQDVFQKIELDTGFLGIVGSIYQSQHEWKRAASYLERAVAASNPPTASLELQLADVYVSLGKQQQAYAIYHRETEDHPENPDAWRGLLGMLHQAGRDRDAYRILSSMPESTRLRLSANAGFLQTLASIQLGVGQNRNALRTFERLSAIYADQNTPEPVDVQIQYGWALLKSGDDRKLYTLIGTISHEPDVTDDEQAELGRLLAAWSVRRADNAFAAGDQRRSIAILEAAARAIPGNADVLQALAGGYLRVGEPKRAVAIYESLDMSQANLGQYQGAIGSALAAGDNRQAAAWLESALDRFQNDATILRLAAEYEQAVGNSKRAVAYYRAALAAMGPETSTGLFSHGGNGTDGMGEPENIDSPTRNLMNLLAPGGRGNVASNSGNRSGAPSGAWPQDTDNSNTSSLGDFADTDGNSAGNPTVAVRNGNQRGNSLADFATPQQNANKPLSWPEDRPGSNLPNANASTDGSNSHAVAQLQDATNALADKDDDSGATSAGQAGDGGGGAHALTGKKHEHSLLSLFRHHRNSHDKSSKETAGVAHSNSTMQDAAPDPSTQDLSAQKKALTQSASPPPAVEFSTSTPTLQATPLQEQEFTATTPLPPLTGPDFPNQKKTTPREDIRNQLALIEGSTSAWLGGTSTLAYRSGQPGYDRLSTYSAQAEASTMFGSAARVTLLTMPVLLDAGAATGAETVRQGTLSATAIPTTQSASGLADEVQLRTPSFAAAIGTTPRGFLISNLTGGVYVHPPSGHFTLTLSREPIVDTQLSYAGLRDEGSISPIYQGNVWGGVISNGGELQVASGGGRSGWYIQGGGQYISGTHVPNNKRFDGDFGAYWNLWNSPEYGSLTAGMNFFAMHYAHNLRYFTYGQGGYFSPDAYVVAGLPFTFNGHYQQKFHYRISGSLGLQAFNEASSLYYPLDPAVQTANGNLSYPSATNVGGNYNFESEGSYAIADHWYTGGFMEFNNTRDYESSKVGFFVRYLFRRQPVGVDSGPTGLFPVTGFRPLRVP